MRFQAEHVVRDESRTQWFALDDQGDWAQQQLLQYAYALRDASAAVPLPCDSDASDTSSESSSQSLCDAVLRHLVDAPGIADGNGALASSSNEFVQQQLKALEQYGRRYGASNAAEGSSSGAASSWSVGCDLLEYGREVADDEADAW